MKTLTPDAILAKLRKLCLRFPDTTEVVTFAHTTFKVSGRIFPALEEHKGQLGIAIKVGTLMQDLFLKDPRFISSAYAARYGWVTLLVHAAPLNWDEIGELVKGSYFMAQKKTARRSSE